MMDLITLALSTLALGLSAWDWWRLRHVRRALRRNR